MNLLADESNPFGIHNETGSGNFSAEVTQSPKPYRDPLYVIVPITIIYAAIFLTGIVGNVSTCVVIARNKHMHTATNYYLFSLAISDLLLLVSGLPPEMFFMWRKHSYVFGETFCVLQSFAAETSANATVLTITAFTIERYVAICHPFQSHTLSKLSRAVKFVIAIWISALGLAVPQAIQYGVVTVVGASGSGSISTESYCTLKKVLIPNAFLISICVFFVVPMTVITVLYVLIGLKLRRSRLIKRPSVKRRDASGQRTLASQSHVIRMLVAVVVGFFICWAPFHAQRLVAMYGHLDEHPSKTVYTVYIFLTYISGVLYYLSTTINPLLYHIMSHKFRNAFKSTLVQICSGKKRKSGIKRNFYITIPRQADRMSFRNQNSVNLVSFKPLTKKSPSSNGNLHSVSSVAVAAGPTDESRRQRKPMRTMESADSALFFQAGNGSPEEETKISNVSNLNGNHRLDRNPETEAGRVEKSRNETATDSVEINENDPTGKCTCRNCDKKSKGISSLAGRCTLKAKSQAATLETIAKKIRLLPNTAKNKFSKDRDRSGESVKPEKKFKLGKAYGSCSISNSSLQDLDESEFTSSELADIMGQLKHGHEVQV